VATALIWLAPVYPCVAVGFATVILATSELLERLHLEPRWLMNEVAFYGVFYGPLAACYVDVKRKCLKRYAGFSLGYPGST
jgi:hypothetical protein